MANNGPVGAGELRIARVYDPPGPSDGDRVLIDRLWPRGLSKQAAALDEWCRDVAPSTELRRWYSHDPKRFAEFTARYRAELTEPDAVAALERLRARSRDGIVTLLTAVKELDLSHAAVLATVIAEPG
jgi:uncharacterized protein YeaO (DUF488 family)